MQKINTIQIYQVCPCQPVNYEQDKEIPIEIQIKQIPGMSLPASILRARYIEIQTFPVKDTNNTNTRYVPASQHITSKI